MDVSPDKFGGVCAGLGALCQVSCALCELWGDGTMSVRSIGGSSSGLSGGGDVNGGT